MLLTSTDGRTGVRSGARWAVVVAAPHCSDAGREVIPMKRRTLTDDELQVGEARQLAKLRKRIMSAMAAEADLDGMLRARAELVNEFKAAHKSDDELCKQADAIARVFCC